jgi:uncharacterized membrane protein (DUF106 family)
MIVVLCVFAIFDEHRENELLASGEKLKDLQAQLAAAQAETRAAQRDIDTIKHEMARDFQV